MSGRVSFIKFVVAATVLWCCNRKECFHQRASCPCKRAHWKIAKAFQIADCGNIASILRNYRSLLNTMKMLRVIRSPFLNNIDVICSFLFQHKIVAAKLVTIYSRIGFVSYESVGKKCLWFSFVFAIVIHTRLIFFQKCRRCCWETFVECILWNPKKSVFVENHSIVLVLNRKCGGLAGSQS